MEKKRNDGDHSPTTAEAYAPPATGQRGKKVMLAVAAVVVVLVVVFFLAVAMG